MMEGLFRWWQFVLIGMGIASMFWLIIIFLLGIWAGWPRARERELERENDELREYIEGLTDTTNSVDPDP